MGGNASRCPRNVASRAHDYRAGGDNKRGYVIYQRHVGRVVRKLKSRELAERICRGFNGMCHFKLPAWRFPDGVDEAAAWDFWSVDEDGAD